MTGYLALIRHLTWAWLFALLSLAPASACIVETPLRLSDIRQADAIVVGSVKQYEIVEYEDDYGVNHQYGLISVEVEKSLKGRMSGNLSLIWLNSTFALPPGLLLTDPALIAITKNRTVGIPRGSALPIKEYPPLILDSHCGGPFILPFSPKMNASVQKILADQAVEISEKEINDLLYGSTGDVRDISAVQRRESGFGLAYMVFAAILMLIMVSAAVIWRRKRRRRAAASPE